MYVYRKLWYKPTRLHDVITRNTMIPLRNTVNFFLPPWPLTAKTTLSFNMVGTTHPTMEHHILKARAIYLLCSIHSATLILVECSQGGEYEDWFSRMWHCVTWWKSSNIFEELGTWIFRIDEVKMDIPVSPIHWWSWSDYRASLSRSQ